MEFLNPETLHFCDWPPDLKKTNPKNSTFLVSIFLSTLKRQKSDHKGRGKAEKERKPQLWKSQCTFNPKSRYFRFAWCDRYGGETKMNPKKHTKLS